MLKVIALNTQGGQFWQYGLRQFYTEQEKTTDIFCLQEVHRFPNPPYLFRRATKGYQQNILVDQYNMIRQQLEEPFDGYWGASLSFALHDTNPVDDPISYGNAVFTKQTLETIDYRQGFIWRKYGELNSGSPAARNMQVVTTIKDGRVYVIAHFHGLWNGKGKGDCRERSIQTANANRLLQQVCEQCEEDTGLKPRVVLTGDFNLVSGTNALRGLMGGKAFGESGAVNLNWEFGISDTRTRHYEKPVREADFMLVSRNLVDEIVSFKAPAEPAISDHRPLVLVCE